MSERSERIMSTGSVRRRVVTVGDAVATVVAPIGPTNGRVLFCLPGGGMSRRYFDLEGEDGAGPFSMAEHLAGRGFVVTGIDHPGVGDTPPPDDPWTLTPEVVADADAAVVSELRDRIGCELAIGVGHSMGAMLSVVVQSRHRCYDALGLLGWSHDADGYATTDLAAHLTPDEQAVVGDRDAIAAHLVELAKARFGEPLPRGTTATSDFLLAGMPVTDVGLRAIEGSASSLLALCGLGSMLRGTDQDVAAIGVPVFVGVGDRDITGDARATARALAASPDITLFELAGSGHNHNVAPNRAVLWDRLATWAEGLTIN